MANSIRCDLAVEAREMVTEIQGEDYVIPGVSVDTESVHSYIHITRVHVESEEGQKQLGKAPGHYITIEMPARFYGQQKIYEEMCKVCARELTELTKSHLKTENDSVLVIGLGNWNITADALGPRVIHSLMITRHLKEYMPEEIDEGIRPVSGISPGVLGLTGIETGEIVRGLVEKLKPNLVIAIDALCSRKVERVNTTIQFSDTGITPGAGVGNKRQAIDESTLGVPVIAIGVPTVVDAATIAGDSIDWVLKRLGEQMQSQRPLYQFLKDLEGEDKYELIRESIAPAFGNFIVAPKEVDSIIEDISRVIANGINISLHRGITLSDIDRYV
ncbi:MAG: GPR endopeptidase [Clostridia bacterium]|nr:GPR endopeptidase [Clostridia bacterium]